MERNSKNSIPTFKRQSSTERPERTARAESVRSYSENKAQTADREPVRSSRFVSYSEIREREDEERQMTERQAQRTKAVSTLFGTNVQETPRRRTQSETTGRRTAQKSRRDRNAVTFRRESGASSTYYRESRENTRRAPSRNRRRTNRKKSGSAKTLAGRIGACIGTLIAVVLVFLVGVLIIVNRGPSEAFRDQFVMTVTESSAGGFLATWFLPQETVDKILEENAIKTGDTISSGDDVVIATPAPDTKPIEIKDIKGKTFTGKICIVADPSRVFIGTPPKGYGKNKEGMTTLDMAKYYGAEVAINGGGFYDTGKGNGGVPTGRQNSDGIVIHEGKMLWGSKGNTYEVIGIDKDRKLVLGKMTGGQALERGIQEALNFGPYLIIDGEPQSIGSAMTEGGLNPRSAIGQRKDGAILLVVINGRQPNSLGASYDDLISVMLDYGAVNAANLDGGSSSYMVQDNKIITTCASLYGPRKMATSFLVKR